MIIAEECQLDASVSASLTISISMVCPSHCLIWSTFKYWVMELSFTSDWFNRL